MSATLERRTVGRVSGKLLLLEQMDKWHLKWICSNKKLLSLTLHSGWSIEREEIWTSIEYDWNSCVVTR